jgi:hypothetical protein
MSRHDAYLQQKPHVRFQRSVAYMLGQCTCTVLCGNIRALSTVGGFLLIMGYFGVNAVTRLVKQQLSFRSFNAVLSYVVNFMKYAG